MKYWTGDEYLSFGPCAASDFAGKRFTIAPDIEKYMDGVLNKGAILSECETVPMRERAGEYLMLRLRTVDGVEEGEYTKSFLLPFEPLEEVFQKLASRTCAKTSRPLAPDAQGLHALQLHHCAASGAAAVSPSRSPRKITRGAPELRAIAAKTAKKN